jgi:hypothetical protein
MMMKFEILNDCEIVVFDGNSGEKKLLKSGEILEMDVIGHPKKVVARKLVEDTQTLNVRFEDGRFSMIDAKNVKKTS